MYVLWKLDLHGQLGSCGIQFLCTGIEIDVHRIAQLCCCVSSFNLWNKLTLGVIRAQVNIYRLPFPVWPRLKISVVYFCSIRCPMTPVLGSWLSMMTLPPACVWTPLLSLQHIRWILASDMSKEGMYMYMYTMLTEWIPAELHVDITTSQCPPPKSLVLPRVAYYRLLN